MLERSAVHCILKFEVLKNVLNRGHKSVKFKSSDCMEKVVVEMPIQAEKLKFCLT
jgi:hypothetical protein